MPFVAVLVDSAAPLFSLLSVACFLSWGRGEFNVICALHGMLG